MAEVRIRYWAAARSAAGRAEESIEAPTCAAALAEVLARDPEAELTRILGACSFLVDGIRRSPQELESIAAPALLEALPPFAGG